MTESLDAESHEQFMRVALDEARRALAAGEPPVGACIVAGGQVVSRASNAVIAELDVTAHAEIRAIREACAKRRSLTLADCRIYSTVEPCAMCFAACHYAGISAVVFGATLDDMRAVTENELAAPRPDEKTETGQARVIGHCLRDECRALLGDWSLRRQGRVAS